MDLAAFYARIDFANSRQPRASERSNVFLRSADCQRRAHRIPSADLLNQRRALLFAGVDVKETFCARLPLLTLAKEKLVRELTRLFITDSN